MKSTVADYTFAIEVLEDLINDALLSKQVLIVCSTRKALLRQITPIILAPKPREIPASQDDLDEDEPTQEPSLHRFLATHLSQLAAARAVKLVFCPSVKSLRAYLSTYTASADSKPAPENSHKTPALVILDLVLLHLGTPELSVQGLSRTFACAVEAAARNGMSLRLVECKDFHDVGNPHRGYGLWSAQVPLLSSSVRLGGDGANWAGRSISVKTIASRWLRFEEREAVPASPDVQAQAEDEEMLV